MSAADHIEEAVELLQELGLKEYEARCFVGLIRLDIGTAKRLSELTEVPRTRVYDATRVLESKGLIEIHHSSPTEFRAVSLDEATETLRDQYENRVHQLHTSLKTIEGDATGEDDANPQEVWSLAGSGAIENRAEELIDTASDEVLIILCDEAVVTENLIATLNAIDDGIELVVGAVTDTIRNRIQTEVPAATVFTSGLEWLRGEEEHPNTTAVGRLLLVDRSTILVSSIKPDSESEQAIFGEGFGNGLVVIARRLMSAGLLEPRSPGV